MSPPAARAVAAARRLAQAVVVAAHGAHLGGAAVAAVAADAVVRRDDEALAPALARAAAVRADARAAPGVAGPGPRAGSGGDGRPRVRLAAVGQEVLRQLPLAQLGVDVRGGVGAGIGGQGRNGLVGALVVRDEPQDGHADERLEGVGGVVALSGLCQYVVVGKESSELQG